MAPMTLERFRSVAVSIDGRELQIIRQRRRFRIDIAQSGLMITPTSSGKHRSLPWSVVARVLERLNETGSFAPGDYRDQTFDASYVLAILKVLTV